MPRFTKLLLLALLAIALFVPSFFLFDFLLRSDNTFLRLILAGFMAPMAASSGLAAIVYFSGKEATWGPYHWSANFDIQIDWEDALLLCRDSLNVLARNHTVDSISKGTTEIVATAPWHWKHGGEQEVYFEFWDLGNSLVRIELSLTKKISRSLIDGGKFKRETEAIVEFVKSQVGSARLVRCTPVYSVD